MCVPVAPGRSRVIWAFPRNVGVWLDKIIPRWYYHIGQNAILDSDVYLLHIEVTFFGSSLVILILILIQAMCFLHSRSAILLQPALITGRKLAMCPHHRIAWSSPSETGSESTASVRLAGLNLQLIICHQLPPRISSWKGKADILLHGNLKLRTPEDSSVHREFCDA